MWGQAVEFQASVLSVWRGVYSGTKMFRVIKKLKALKPVLKKLNHTCFSDIENTTTIVGLAPANIQKALADKPGDLGLIQQELDLASDLKELTVARDSFLSQKAKLQWSIEGDLNTSFFHHAIKKRVMMNKFFQIEDKDGKLCTEGSDIQLAFLDYYQSLLGSHEQTISVQQYVVRRGHCCTEEHGLILAQPVTIDEVKHSIFSIPNAIINFFESGQLLAQINSTVITLIPKIDRPSSVKHFRPISCCNIMYKAISKIMYNRLARVLPDIISRNQGAFVKGRSILENILICQDLFVDQMLQALNFPDQFRKLLVLCITTPSYTLNLNSSQFGFFKGNRGLRQGDHISPLIFCICMEYLTRVMEYATGKWALSTFSETSGLRVNAAKSEVVFNGVPDGVRMDIVQIRGIGARKLSYAGRLILINSVLNTLHNYWASIFLIPKGVIRRIEAICRNFFWSSESDYHRVPLIAWEKVCCRKREGGLDIKQAEVWNKATFGNLVNWIHTKASRLWVLWIDHVYLKGAEWATYQPPPDSNWNWRNICKVKYVLSAGFVEGHWQADVRGYSISSGCHWLLGPHPLIQWYNSVWASWNIPKHSMIGWMVMHKGLNTRDKLYQLQISDRDSCVICEQAIETHEHLFCSCAYGSQVIDGIESWLNRRLNGSNMNCTKLQKLVCKMALMACWYCIWHQRNQCRLSMVLTSPRKVVMEVQSMVRTRILQKIQNVVPSKDRSWLLSLGVNV
ncbi:uncharacterized protein LOC141639983 [Silene latifolia]|uniref:uncharacterized protein LOC141639983 n=1 Tax=Silene latifolia TaxID=37657 RepID=UPI003D780797